MKKLLALFIMCFVAVGYGQSTPLVTPLRLVYNETFYGPYDTLNEAATYAVKKSYELSNHFEFAGLLVQDKATGKYWFTLPHSDFAIDHVLIDHDVIWPNHPEMVIVSEYHTHPCFPYTHVPLDFSPNDVYNYLVYHQVGYMGNFCNGAVQKWDPTDIYYLDELDGEGPYGVDPQTTYGGEVVGKISLNKKPIVQETLFEAMVQFAAHEKK